MVHCLTSTPIKLSVILSPASKTRETEAIIILLIECNLISILTKPIEAPIIQDIVEAALNLYWKQLKLLGWRPMLG